MAPAQGTVLAVRGDTSMKPFLEPLLAAAAAALPAGQVPSSLSFTPGELRLGGLSPAPGDTEAWADAVRARGVSLRFEAGELVLTASGTR